MSKFIYFVIAAACLAGVFFLPTVQLKTASALFYLPFAFLFAMSLTSRRGKKYRRYRNPISS